MPSLLYRPDWNEARKRYAAWWNGEDIGRPAMHITAPRAEPIEHIDALPVPEGVVAPNYTVVSEEFRVNLALRACLGTHYLAEAAPAFNSGDLAPNCLALYLGCRGVEMPGTVWCEPFLDEPTAPDFRYNPDNFYWRFTLDVHAKTMAQSQGKFLQAFPDLIEGLDTLAAMRGTQQLLIDLIERPEWVRACIRQITDLYFHYYDILYDLFRDDMGGSHWWTWAPGRCAKFQCDFSAMISAPMFAEFMGPVLTEMTERVSYSLYHFDGPGALQHTDCLVSIPNLDMIQWTPGDGVEPCWDKRWWPMFHKVLDAGKKLMVWVGSLDDLRTLRHEFGPKMNNMLITLGVARPEDVGEVFKAAEGH
jgi:hypothetical protein